MTLGEKSIGDVVYTKFWKEGDSETEGRWNTIPWMVVHKGKPDAGYDDSFLGGTILMACPTYSGREVFMSSADGQMEKCDYGSTFAHCSDLQGDADSVLGFLDPMLTELVKTVKLPYRRGTTGNEVAGGADGLEAKVWLPSVAEIARDGQSCWVVEGAPFAYWQDKTAETYQRWRPMAESETDPDYWFTRTPCSDSDNKTFMAIRTDSYGGGLAYTPEYQYHGNTAGLGRPCMVMPDETMIDANDRLVAAPPVGCKIGGVWREGTASCKVNGVWREVTHISGRVNGIWKE